MKAIEVAGAYKLPYIIKAERTSYLIFLIIIGPLIIFGAIIALQDPSAWPVPFLFALMLGMLWLIIGSGKISLLEDKIVFKTLTTKNEMSYREISRIEIEYKSTGKGFFPALSLHKGTGEKAISINIKPFSRRDLAIVGDVLSAKAPQANKLDAIGIVWQH